METDRCHIGLMRVICFLVFVDSWFWLLELIDRSVRGDVSFFQGYVFRVLTSRAESRV